MTVSLPRFFDRHALSKLFLAIIILVNLSTSAHVPSTLAAGSNYVTSSPPSGAYSVTPWMVSLRTLVLSALAHGLRWISLRWSQAMAPLTSRSLPPVPQPSASRAGKLASTHRSLLSKQPPRISLTCWFARCSRITRLKPWISHGDLAMINLLKSWMCLWAPAWNDIVTKMTWKADISGEKGVTSKR